MQIRLKLKPVIFRSTTREEALSAVRRGMSIIHSSSFGCALQGVWYQRHDRESVRVYSVQKIRAKSQQHPKKGKTTPLGFVRAKEKLTDTQIECVYYDIPVAMLKLMGKKVEQGNKTWRFV